MLILGRPGASPAGGDTGRQGHPGERDPDPLPLEELLEDVLMDVEQRGRLIITIDRTGG